MGIILDSPKGSRRRRDSRSLDHRCLFSYTDNLPYSRYPKAMEACQKGWAFIATNRNVIGRSIAALLNVNRIHGCGAGHAAVLSHADMGDDIGTDLSKRCDHPKPHTCYGDGHSRHVDHFWPGRAVSHPAKYRGLAWYCLGGSLGDSDGAPAHV